jgi:hypothetical protein
LFGCAILGQIIVAFIESLLKAETNSFTHYEMGTYDPDGHEMA